MGLSFFFCSIQDRVAFRHLFWGGKESCGIGNNKSFRIGAFYGYISHGLDRIYMPDALGQDILVVSSQTGFMIDYLIEIVSDVHLLQVDDLLSLTFFELKLMFLVSGLL